MKKLTALLLTCVSFFSLCTACKDSESSTEQPENLIEINSLVENNQTAYSVVLPANASNCLEYAALELQNFVSESTSASLKVITEEKAVYDEQKCYISLGKTTLLDQANFNFDYSTLNGDGFFIKTVGNMVFIDGNLDRSVL